MAPPNKSNPPVRGAADAHYGRVFDPWNSVGTGHQRAESRGPQGWRESRNLKLRSQFAAGHTGGERMSDAVRQGPGDFDERYGVVVPKHVRARTRNDVADMLRRQAPSASAPRHHHNTTTTSSVLPTSALASSSSTPSSLPPPPTGKDRDVKPAPTTAVEGNVSLYPVTTPVDPRNHDGDAADKATGWGDLVTSRRAKGGERDSGDGGGVGRGGGRGGVGGGGTRDGTEKQEKKKIRSDEMGLEETVTGETGRGNGRIFDGLVVYVNGSTHPMVSDHKLKRVLTENGAHVSLHLGRRQVTHIILGRPAGRGSGAGGGLAAGKLEREIRRVGGCGVKYVGVEWVLESIKTGKRLPETKFANLKMAPKGQQSVYGLLSKGH